MELPMSFSAIKRLRFQRLRRERLSRKTSFDNKRIQRRGYVFLGNDEE